jgi:hypothetical protein
LAKQLIPVLVEQFEMANIPDLQLEVLSPTSTMTLGGNNAACVLVVCTSLSQASSLSSMLDRLLRNPDSSLIVFSARSLYVSDDTAGADRPIKCFSLLPVRRGDTA